MGCGRGRGTDAGRDGGGVGFCLRRSLVWVEWLFVPFVGFFVRLLRFSFVSISSLPLPSFASSLSRKHETDWLSSSTRLRSSFRRFVTLSLVASVPLKKPPFLSFPSLRRRRKHPPRTCFTSFSSLPVVYNSLLSISLLSCSSLASGLTPRFLPFLSSPWAFFVSFTYTHPTHFFRVLLCCSLSLSSLSVASFVSSHSPFLSSLHIVCFLPSPRPLAVSLQKISLLSTTKTPE